MRPVAIDHVPQDDRLGASDVDASTAPGLVAVDDVVLDSDHRLRAIFVTSVGVDTAAALRVIEAVRLVVVNLVVGDQHLAVALELDEDAAASAVAVFIGFAEPKTIGDAEAVYDGVLVGL